MKSQRFNKKLTLTKVTVADLHRDEQARIKGGKYTKPDTVCLTCIEPSVCLACVTTVC